jgi:SynChlorMet cassette radical SAM/SPASM protein ScmE
MSNSQSADQGTHLPKIMRTPRSVDVEITAQCNLRCKYCYFFDNQAANYIDLSTAEWLQFFEELGSISVMDVCLAGGEPFIRRDLPQLISGIVKNRMRFSILTNGSRINDEIASFIAGTRRCNHVQVSVDGSCPEIHDSCRGEGSFVGAIRGIRTLQRYNVPVTVRVTIHHHNVHDLENIAHLLLEDLGLKAFSTNSAGVMGTCRMNQENVLLTAQDRIAAMNTLLLLNEKYKGRISAAAGPLAEAQTWSRMEGLRRRGAPPLPYGGHLTARGCPRSKIAIRPDGIITPCSLLSHIKLGRINQDSLAKIWLESPELNMLRQRASISLTEFEFCRGCPYTPYCTGNCPSLAYSLIGQLNHPSPDACLQHFLKEPGASSFMNDLMELSEQPFSDKS